MVIAELKERVELRVHACAQGQELLNQIVVAVGLPIDGAEESLAAQETLGPYRVARVGEELAIAHLRHEAVVRSEVLADVLNLGEPVDVCRGVLPPELHRVIIELAPIPLFRQIRTLGRARL